MSSFSKSSFFSSNILNNQETLNPRPVPFVKPHFANASLVEGSHTKFGKEEFNFETDYILEPAQGWIIFPGKHQVEFPQQTIQPKVQKLRQVPLRTLPRDVEIDRLRRTYAKVLISDLLEKEDIPYSKLITADKNPKDQDENTFKEDFRIGLHVFDDENFDSNTVDGWFQRGVIDGVQYPLPAKALIRKSVDLYSWEMVAVYSYDKQTEQFTVIDLPEAEEHHVHRIHLMFMAENPRVFVERIKTAIKRKLKFETRVRYQLLLECLLYDEKPKMNQTFLERIHKLALVNQKSCEEGVLATINTEIQLQYQRVMVSYVIQKFLQSHPEEFTSIKAPEKKFRLPKELPYKSTDQDRKDFLASKKLVRFLNLFYASESIHAMKEVAIECMNIEKFTLLVHTFPKALDLTEFVTYQEFTYQNVVSHLKKEWPANISGKMCVKLRSIGKGWLDLSISDWNIFQVAKIFRFCLQIKFRMQESLQILLEKCILNYSNVLNKPCQDFLILNNDYEWTNDLRTSPFDRLHLPPIFKLVLHLSANGPYYSTDPYAFEPNVTKILYTSLMLTCGIKIIEPDSLLNLPFAKNLYILTVELIEDMYVEHVELLHASYAKAVIPLKAYLENYRCFVEFHELEVDVFIDEFAKSGKSSQEVKNEIIWQKEQKEHLKQIMPEQIIIGPFQIVVEPLKKYLVSKRIEIVRKLFLYYIDRMLQINEELLHELSEIDTKLNEKLVSVEHLFEVKAFMELVPDKLVTLRERIQIMMFEYNVLDSFFYNLSDQQFGMKWEAFAWPYKIVKRLFAMKEEHKIDIEEFKRMQIKEVASFQERLESLNEEIMAFALQFDPEKALEVAVETKKTWKLIVDLQKLGHTLQERQLLFEADELSLDYLESIIESFKPYRTMWTACSDFIKLQEITIGNPLASIDLKETRETVEELTRMLKETAEIFNEKEEVQNVALVYLQKIQEFYPTIEVMDCIKNENWLFMHWQELVLKSGIDIKFSVAMNFQYCIKKGILNHVALVKEICERAVHEADNIRLAMEEEARLKREAELLLLERKKNRKCRTDIM